MGVKGLKEPDDERGHKNNGKGPLQEVPGLIPQEHTDALGRGHTVVGQLHDKGHRLAPEGRLFQQQRNQDTHHHAAEVEAAHGQRRIIGEESRREHGVNGNFCRTAHKGRQQDRHAAVAGGRQGARCHDSGDGAAKTDEHGHKAASRQTDLSQELIHNEGHAGHIAGVLQYGKEEEHDHDDRQKADHAAHAGENSVDDQTMYHRVQPIGGQAPVHPDGKAVDGHGKHVLQERAHHIEGQPKDQEHDTHKDRDGGIFVGQHPVDADGAEMLAALSAFDHGLVAQLFDVFIAHGGDGGVAVQAALLLHLNDAVLQQLQLVLVDGKALDYILVALDHLGRRKAPGHASVLGVVLDLVGHGVDAAVDRSVVAEVDALGPPFLFGGKDGTFDQLVDALILCRRDGNHRDSQLLGHFGHVDGAAVTPDLIHHIQSQDQRNVHLQKLEGQVEISLDVGGIDDVDDAVGMLVEDEIPGNDLLAGIGAHGIDARQIGHLAIFLAAELAGLAVHCHTGEIAHVLIGAGQLVEQGGLAAVLVAHQCEHHCSFTSGRISIFAASSRRSVSS